MSKIKETLRRFEESLDAEATRIEEAIEATKMDIRESVEEYIQFEDDKSAYREHYLSKLKEADKDSEDDMDDEEKEEFKKDVEESWTGADLEDSVIEEIKAEAVVTPKFTSDDPREYETDAKGEPNVEDEGGDVIDPASDTIEEPEVESGSDEENEDAAPEDEEVDDQTDVAVSTAPENKGEKDSQSDPLK